MRCLHPGWAADCSAPPTWRRRRRQGQGYLPLPQADLDRAISNRSNLQWKGATPPDADPPPPTPPADAPMVPHPRTHDSRSAVGPAPPPAPHEPSVPSNEPPQQFYISVAAQRCAPPPLEYVHCALPLPAQLPALVFPVVAPGPVPGPLVQAPRRCPVHCSRVAGGYVGPAAAPACTPDHTLHRPRAPCCCARPGLQLHPRPQPYGRHIPRAPARETVSCTSFPRRKIKLQHRAGAGPLAPETRRAISEIVGSACETSRARLVHETSVLPPPPAVVCRCARRVSSVVPRAAQCKSQSQAQGALTGMLAQRNPSAPQLSGGTDAPSRPSPRAAAAFHAASMAPCSMAQFGQLR